MIRTPEEFVQTAMVKLMRLCYETFGVIKYCLDLKIKIFYIYPLIALVEVI